MHGHPGGLVDRQQVLILKQHHKLAGGRGKRGRGHILGFLGHSLRHPDWRQAHQVAGLHSRIGANTPLVDPHLAAANDAVDVGFGHALEVTHQVVVEPLAGTVVVDG